VVVVPFGNSPEKSAAMRALGVELIEHGQDFRDAVDHAASLAGSEGLWRVPSFDPMLVATRRFNGPSAGPATRKGTTGRGRAGADDRERPCGSRSCQTTVLPLRPPLHHESAPLPR
jgi:hypothetical protein